ncbi:uncharacterized protein SPPG_08297 [Spizellomyces punctatus DAOM BR117]|uniref:Nucleolus and neural progenitor protein-like N-terminal domain-containing protein n=1 Tax=Spizellomyces punctatus (strain DAOM BR117) TaxID=645134 RepID=A0A0L0H6P0_SPIPD|nr:uncharacterized protein SPPG_08297 [Spizellomyces punctatus DAOM BR117]KNC96398.1 hypothetical protein SPPG_08297 [Spizellomyces punctatus DAOM BR117]|eukprot:XP_016604438.1 hypothetical protein SPPG_08297 [Spizellomyces punctatus DAOM BR117]
MTSIYNDRYLQCPLPTPVVPRTDLTLPSGYDADDLPRKLYGFRRALSPKEFWAEQSVLDRVRYKNSNQHQGSLHFRKLLEVRRLSRRFGEMELDKLIKDILDVMHCNRTKKTQGRWECLPSHPYMCYVLARLMGAYGLLLRLLIALRNTYLAFRAVARQTYFMAVSLVIMASCARLHLLSRHMLNGVEQCYQLLMSWTQSLPVRGSNDSSGSELPPSLRANLFDASGGVSMTESTGALDEMCHYDTQPSASHRPILMEIEQAAAVSDEFWSAGIGDTTDFDMASLAAGEDYSADGSLVDNPSIDDCNQESRPTAEDDSHEGNKANLRGVRKSITAEMRMPRAVSRAPGPTKRSQMAKGDASINERAKNGIVLPNQATQVAKKKQLEKDQSEHLAQERNLDRNTTGLACLQKKRKAATRTVTGDVLGPKDAETADVQSHKKRQNKKLPKEKKNEIDDIFGLFG